MTPLVHRVIERREESDGVVSLALVRPRGADPGLDQPAPGQFNMLWAFGVGEAPISLSGLDDGVLWHTIRRVGAVTNALCDLEEGDELGVRGPFGRGWGPLPDADVVVVAGGLGLVPLMPLLRELAASPNHGTGRRLGAALVGSRDPASGLFGAELRACAETGLRVASTVDSAPPGWPGRVGLVTELLADVELGAGTRAYVCGPEVMMRHTALALADRGVAPGSIMVSLERNMHCAIGHCGHCQLGAAFVCRDGPVFAWERVRPLMEVRQL